MDVQSWRIFSVVCGVPALEPLLIYTLEAQGFQHDHTEGTLLLFDLPCGFALRELPHTVQQYGRVIVLTDNPCPEYREDLWKEGPAGLLAGIRLDQTLVEAMMLVQRGARYRYPPSGASPLTAQERAVLRDVAHGLDNRQIAQHLRIEEKSVRNILTRVYVKLTVANRVQAALYYWGREPLFK